jgi:hypothetical protein
MTSQLIYAIFAQNAWKTLYHPFHFWTTRHNLYKYYIHNNILCHWNMIYLLPFTPNSYAWIFMSTWLFVTMAFHSRHRGWRTEDGRHSYSPWSNRTSCAFPLGALLTRTAKSKTCDMLTLLAKNSDTILTNSVLYWIQNLALVIPELGTGHNLKPVPSSLYPHNPSKASKWPLSKMVHNQNFVCVFLLLWATRPVYLNALILPP